MQQEDFRSEYIGRYPHADVIPTVEDYVNGGEPIYHGIPDMPADPFTMDGPKEEAAAQKPAQVFPCRGCKKEFSLAIARAGHERFCKSLVKEKAHA